MQRVTQEIAPILDRTVEEPQAEGGLQAFAEDNGLTVEAAKEEWVRLQEADLMLESGGDPDALSSAGAAGAAQWLASSAQGVGLKVKTAESRQLTSKITEAKWRISWIEYLSRPDADSALPYAPQFIQEELNGSAKVKEEMEALRTRRQMVDERYAVEKAVTAQTLYLLKMYTRYPSPDWLFQAYHGGEGGVNHLLKLYCGAQWSGSAALAIRTGSGSTPLTFEDVYFHCSPREHSEAFQYLFGRSDDHRHYWWKLLAARELIALYRKSPVEFQKRWEAALPGRRTEALWYPNAASTAFSDLTSLQNARKTHQLVEVSENADLSIRPARDDAANTIEYQVLRPEAKGALLLIAHAFRSAGGRERLTVGDMSLTTAYSDRAKLLHPGKPPIPPVFPPDMSLRDRIGGGPAREFDYHTVGIAFDILRPKSEGDRKALEYALDSLQNRLFIDALDAKDRDERRYHIVPHPRYGQLLSHLAFGGEYPSL